MAKLPYDPLKDLTPITVAVTQPYAVCVTNSLPAKTVKDVIALATPPAIISKLNAEAVKALRAKDNVDALAKAGNEPVANTPKEAMEFLKVEIAHWGKVIKMAGVAPQ
jgi:tripartite-type tricarboxylate transporter receptor subunit TctC